MGEKNTGFELMEPASPGALVPDYGLWPWFVAAAAVVIAATILIVFVRRKSAAAPHPHAARNAAFAEAAAALAGPTPGSARDAAVQSSLVLRKYLSAAAGDPALFETHEEFVSRHDALQALKPDARAAAETGFTRLAALKYAPEIPDADPDADPAAVIAESRTLLETLHHGFAA